MTTPLLILASRSPRRAQLLREADYAFIQIEPPFADPPEPDSGAGTPDPFKTAIDLASRKALSLRDTGVLHAHPGALILAADTICVAEDGSLLGQPPDRAAARSMLRRFLGQTHRVVTGFALMGVNDAQPDAHADLGIVTMGTISDAELDAYVNSDQWQGKAGGYNLFERQQAGWPITVVGDPTNIVGLPMQALKTLIMRDIEATKKERNAGV